VAVVSSDTLALLALAVSALIVGGVAVAVWIWRYGWRSGQPPRE
jgi:hypothetical protein